MKTVAILGASDNPNKYGYRSIFAHQNAGFHVYPVNHKYDQIAGMECFRSLNDVPKPLDRISIYLPSHITIDLLDEIQQVGASEIWLNPGAESDELIAAMEERNLPIIIACSIINL